MTKVEILDQQLGETKDMTDEKAVIDLNNSEYYINRELSHLQFNIRVLEQTLDESHPLLDRLFFLCIFSKNLDEFYEVRVADLVHQLTFAREQAGIDGLHPAQVLEEIYTLCSATVERQYDILNNTLLPALTKENINFLRRAEWTDEQRLWIREYFDDSIQPLISPIGLDPSHPFPRLVNKSLNFIVSLDGKTPLVAKRAWLLFLRHVHYLVFYAFLITSPLEAISLYFYPPLFTNLPMNYSRG